MIKTLKIRNFRSIAKADLKFGKLNIIIGKNQVGKTNLFKAVKLLFDKERTSFKKEDFFNQDTHNSILIEAIVDNSVYKVYSNGYNIVREITASIETSEDIKSNLNIKADIILKKGPENFVHPRKIRDIVDNLTDIAYNTSSQIFVITYSPYFLDFFKERTEEVITVRKVKGETVFSKLKE